MLGALHLTAVLAFASTLIGVGSAQAADIVIERGDSRRPRVEVPALPAPAFEGEAENVAPSVPPRSHELGGSGDYRPGELRQPFGVHKPGNMDSERRYRPGDLS